MKNIKSFKQYGKLSESEILEEETIKISPSDYILAYEVSGEEDLYEDPKNLKTDSLPPDSYSVETWTKERVLLKGSKKSQYYMVDREALEEMGIELEKN